MTSAVTEIDCHHVSSAIADLAIHTQAINGEASEQTVCESYGFCAICLEQIHIQETALVKGCEHAYCLTCILRWASYKENTTCPQCKHLFESLIVHRTLDGSIQVYMQEESVCLLLRATWFEPLLVKQSEEPYDELDDFYAYGYADGDSDDDMDEAYYHSSTLRIGNRRWGDNGYVRNGRQEARPVYLPNAHASSSSSSRERKQKKPAEPATGRRAKRALKREAADKAAAAAAKHQLHLERLGRK